MRIFWRNGVLGVRGMFRTPAFTLFLAFSKCAAAAICVFGRTIGILIPSGEGGTSGEGGIEGGHVLCCPLG